MGNRRRVRMVCGIFTLVAGGMLSMATARADSVSDLAQTLAGLNKGVSVEEVRAQTESIAKQEGCRVDEVLAALIKEVEDASPSVTARSGVDVLPDSSSGGGDGTVVLGAASRSGDVFYSPAKTAFVPHGHVGIYYGRHIIVEAPGGSENSRSAMAVDHKVPRGTEKMWVGAPLSITGAAGKYAYDHLRFKPYNNIFFRNKWVVADRYNCSQLVWAAYKAVSSVDLDSNGGWGVYPNDIKNSPWVHRYETRW